MPDDISQPPEMLTGGCMCGAVRYTNCRKAARYRPLPLQPLPAAIRKRLLDSDLRTSQRGDDHR